MPEDGAAGGHDAVAGITIDARYLEPPEPFILTMEALDRLPPGGCIQLLLHREPFLLYHTLDQNGFTHRAKQEADGTYVVEIRHT